jgi:hypothetical protein
MSRAAAANRQFTAAASLFVSAPVRTLPACRHAGTPNTRNRLQNKAAIVTAVTSMRKRHHSPIQSPDL